MSYVSVFYALACESAHSSIGAQKIQQVVRKHCWNISIFDLIVFWSLLVREARDEKSGTFQRIPKRKYVCCETLE